MGARSQARWAIMITLVLVAAAACGTRLPDSSFQSVGQGAANSSAGAGGSANGVDSGGGSAAGGGGGIAAGTGGGTGGGGTAAGGGAGVTGGGGGAGASGSGGGASTGGGASSGGGTAGAGTGAAGRSVPNFASDVGVTADSIVIGNVTGVNGTLGPDAFSPTLHGLQAYVAATNSRGGLNGRKLILQTCDDGQDGAQNLACSQKLIGSTHVFAFLANNSLTTDASAHYEYTSGVPDLGLPLNNGYYKYPNMFSLYGTPYVRDGNQVGDHGTQWQTTEVYHFFRAQMGVTKAAVFFYSQSASQQQAYAEENGSKAEGIQVVYESGGHSGENLGAANFDADVLAMKNKGVDGVFDAIDIAGNQKVCASMDRYGVKVKAKVSTIEVWSSDIGTPAWSVPCRDSIFVAGSTAPFPDRNVPIVNQFRQDFDAYQHGVTLHQWEVDGYTTGVIFGDAAAAMGGTLTRKGFISWLDAIPLYQYSAHGIIHDVSWQSYPHPATKPTCLSVAQWQDPQGFVTRTGPNEFSCFTTKEVGEPFSPDNS